MGLRAGKKAWEEISIFGFCRELRNDSHQDIGQVNTLTGGHCATSRKVAGSIPDGVIGFFH